MKNIIPFIVNYSPIKKLAIIPFEKKPDKIYKGFELQYIDGKPYGKGYRIDRKSTRLNSSHVF